MPRSARYVNCFNNMAIPRELIDADADKVVRRLAKRGHTAYLVGGCVRDLLLSRTPKDFDVATSATPAEIKATFRNCRIIGRRFRLAHVFFGRNIIETATFRTNPRNDAPGASGDELLIRHDNVFGSVTDDAHRRDFTINGLFYDVETEEVIDHVGGLADLERRLVRTVGDPEVRFQEDPVRMLRAVKFAARLDFSIEPKTYAALLRHRGDITKCAAPRVLEEFYRLMRGGAAHRSMQLLLETGLGAVLSSHLAGLFEQSEDPPERAEQPTDLDEEEAAWAATWTETIASPDDVSLSFAEPNAISGRRSLAWKLLASLDERVAAGRKLSNALILAAVVNPFVAEDLIQPGIRPADANNMLVEVLDPLIDQLRIARKDSERARQIALAQRRLGPSRRRRGKPAALVRRDYFEEALTLYECSAAAEGREAPEVEEWRALMSSEGVVSETEDDGAGSARRRRRRGGRRRRRNPAPEANGADTDPITSP